LRALVVYETLFGNTRTVAMAVGGGLGAGADVRIVDVRDAPATVDDVDLLVVGGPTHQLGMTRSSTRRRAEVQYDEAPHAADTGLREWIASVQMPVGVATATFDTLLEHPGVLRAFGHAARATGRRLQRRGARIIPPAQRFLVVSATGPLAAGEADRAREWGRRYAGRSMRRSDEYADPAPRVGARKGAEEASSHRVRLPLQTRGGWARHMTGC
jgi:hypothetical protein